METAEMVLKKSVTVAETPEVAFRVFTEGIDSWWPRATHSVGEEKVAEVVFEPGVGGRLLERHADGAEHVWGRVTEWEPPERVAYTWYPGRGEDTAQTVVVTFRPDGDGTRVDIDQRGWEVLGERAEETVASYDGDRGWTAVLALYVEAVERARAPEA
jgi:uncharacterized protein YndB with AHSA1/START domain